MDRRLFQAIWDNCVFTFDANVLLNLYRYSDPPVNHFFEILEKVGERIWLTYQSSYEYHKNRRNKIEEQLGVYRGLKDDIEGAKNRLIPELSNKYDKHPILDIEKVVNEIENGFNKAIKSVGVYEKKHPDINKEDTIQKRITGLFDGKVGDDFPHMRKREVITEAELRYQIYKPPGYEDRKKPPPSKYGDLFFWFQVIEFSHRRKTDIVLVSDERKGDWWQKLGNKEYTPRPELISEFYEETSNEILY